MAKAVQTPVQTPSSGMNSVQLSKAGNSAYERMDKVSAEFFAMTYGSLVCQVCCDCTDDCDEINKTLDAMGQRIGARLVDEYIAKSNTPRCRSFKDTGEAIAKAGLRMFLGIQANVDNATSSSYSLVFDENPLNLFVELPEQLRGRLWYSNILAGVVRGALDMVSFSCEVNYVRDVLRGHDTNEIRVVLKEVREDTFKQGVE